jgi:hypothetical protein
MFFFLKNYLCHHGVTGEFRHSTAQLGELSHVIQRTQRVQLLQSCKSGSWVKISVLDPDPENHFQINKRTLFKHEVKEIHFHRHIK